MDIRVFFMTLGGLSILGGAISDWDWFMEHHKAQFFNKIWGRQGTRIFYGVIGLILTVIGFAASIGLVDLDSSL